MSAKRSGPQPSGPRSTAAPPSRGSPRTPAPIRFVIRVLLPEEEREFFLGDLEESHHRPWHREILGALALRLTQGSRNGHSRREKTPRKGDGMVKELLHDLRFGIRLMIRSPGFTVVALVTMALGIGANTAMFSVVNGVLLEPLPYPDADRVVLAMENNLERGWTSFTVAPPNFWDWQERNRSMELLAAYQSNTVTYTGGDRPESLRAYKASEDFLEILGGEPQWGRGITAEDLGPDGEPVVLLTHGLWQRAFGGDPDVLGRTMVLDAAAHTVVGVLPESWQPFSRSGVDLVLPLRPDPSWYEARGSHFLRGLGRLRPGVTVEQAQSDLSSVAAALEAEYPGSNAGWGAVVFPLDEVLLGGARSQLLILLASVGLVLLIACANVANMTLARATGRARELAIRTAVGAGRGRVVRQLLAESVFLAGVGGALGIALAYFSLKGFVAGWPTMLPRMQEIEMSGTVLLFSLGVSLVSGVLFGLVPAMSVAGPNLNQTLRQGSRSITGDRSRRWMRTGLVVAEVGLAVVLLVGSGLLIRSFSSLRGEDPGFLTDERLVFSTPLPDARYPTTEDVGAFGDAALAGLEAVPGVESVALTSLIPIGGDDEIWGMYLEGRSRRGAQDDISVLLYRVSPGYFQTMGIPILSGRDITPRDRGQEPLVIMVSESFAKEYYPGENPAGKRIRFGQDDDNPWIEIVGVVGEVQHYNLGQTSMAQAYIPFAQWPTADVQWVIKAGLPPLSLVDEIREAIRAVDPEQPLVEIRAGDALISESIAMPRFRALLMTGFGLMALLLAVVGLYGVMAYSVSQRSKEIGVRMALGASRSSVLSLVFREGMPLVGVGLAAGLAGAFALSTVLESMLFGVGARDPRVFAAVPLVLLAVAVTAMLVPARGAVRVDPVKTLGEE